MLRSQNLPLDLRPRPGGVQHGLEHLPGFCGMDRASKPAGGNPAASRRETDPRRLRGFRFLVPQQRQRRRPESEIAAKTFRRSSRVVSGSDSNSAARIAATTSRRAKPSNFDFASSQRLAFAATRIRMASAGSQRTTSQSSGNRLLIERNQAQDLIDDPRATGQFPNPSGREKSFKSRPQSLFPRMLVALCVECFGKNVARRSYDRCFCCSNGSDRSSIPKAPQQDFAKRRNPARAGFANLGWLGYNRSSPTPSSHSTADSIPEVLTHYDAQNSIYHGRRFFGRGQNDNAGPIGETLHRPGPERGDCHQRPGVRPGGHQHAPLAGF